MNIGDAAEVPEVVAELAHDINFPDISGMLHARPHLLDVESHFLQCDSRED